jgi:hypothetical protein
MYVIFHEISFLYLDTFMSIDEHERLSKNQIFSVYLSNLEVPNVIFAATLDDYAHATLLITQMNKNERLTQTKDNIDNYEYVRNIGQINEEDQYALENSDKFYERYILIRLFLLMLGTLLDNVVQPCSMATGIELVF